MMSEPSLITSEMADKLKMLDFLALVGKLKHLKRAGWVLRDVQNPETVAGHMYRMGMMTFLLDSKDGLDTSRCMKLALVHDLAECIVGDITPMCGVSSALKHSMEMEAMQKVCALAGSAGHEIFALFQEYEGQQSREARAVKELDVFDMILQAYEYEREEGAPGRLQEFFDSTARRHYATPVIAGLVGTLHRERSLHRVRVRAGTQLPAWSGVVAPVKAAEEAKPTADQIE